MPPQWTKKYDRFCGKLSNFNEILKQKDAFPKLGQKRLSEILAKAFPDIHSQIGPASNRIQALAGIAAQLRKMLEDPKISSKQGGQLPKLKEQLAEIEQIGTDYNDLLRELTFQINSTRGALHIEWLASLPDPEEEYLWFHMKALFGSNSSSVLEKRLSGLDGLAEHVAQGLHSASLDDIEKAVGSWVQVILPAGSKIYPIHSPLEYNYVLYSVLLRVLGR